MRCPRRPPLHHIAMALVATVAAAAPPENAPAPPGPRAAPPATAPTGPATAGRDGGAATRTAAPGSGARSPLAALTAAETGAAQAAAQVFRGNAGKLKACYERGLKRNSRLQFVSRVQVRLLIGPEGHSRRVTLAPRVDARLESCIGRAVSHWAFPRYSGDPLTLEVPLGLRVSGG